MNLWNKLLKKFSLRSWEHRLRVLLEMLRGVDFSITLKPTDVGLNPNVSYRSSPSGNKYLRNVLANLSITHKDSIMDIGCGKGSAMRVMLEFPFSRVDGIEISEQIATIARNNFRKLKVPSNRCKIFTIDAFTFQELDLYSHVYFYNPFSGEIMKKVVENLTSSIKRMPRMVIIIYNNAVCHSEVISSGVFQKIVEYPDEWGNMIFLYTNQNSPAQ